MSTSFFDKMKKGVNDAGNKAKNMVEANRLKTQMSQLQREIDFEFHEIGKKVFFSEEESKEETGELPSYLKEHFESIRNKRTEIEFLNLKVLELNGEKLCVGCGKAIPFEVKFCSFCGAENEVPFIPVGDEQAAGPNLFCRNCGNPINTGAKFCVRCGKPVSEE